MAAGPGSPLDRLTEAGVVDIRRRVDAGEPTAAVAADHGVTAGNSRHIAARRAWRHIASAGGIVREGR